MSISEDPSDFRVCRHGGLVNWDSWLKLCEHGEFKLEVLDGELGCTRDQTEALLGLLLEVVGVDRVLALTGRRIWREALDALDSELPHGP